ncbi:MAG TPA: sialate O-acetylesterase [Pseudoxanthomonas sp.]|nr:sialate O-acetylesterase [Pseudoxanthomonas sp.]
MKTSKKGAFALGLFPLGLFALAPLAQAADSPLLHEMFQDHAVLQRDRPIPVWGEAAPGAEVKVSFAGRMVKAKAGTDGRWEAALPAQKAGGPYTLTASSGAASETANDILVGDVWLCSGQSNMELQVKRGLNTWAEISNAHNDRIRMLKVGLKESMVPRAHFIDPVQWKATTPDTVGEFSATCYYFARELQKRVDVPMGLINSSWGGSRIEAWLSAQALHGLGGFDEQLELLARYADDPLAANAGWGELWTKWWRSAPGVEGDEPWKDGASSTGWTAAPRGLGNYREWTPQLADFTGMLWFRTTFRLDAKQAAQGATLALGVADEVDVTWINGRSVGSSYGGGERNYALPAGLLHEGENTLVVNVLNTWSDGGLTGDAPRALRFADGSSMPLDRGWQYRVVPKQAGTPPQAPWLSAQGKGTLFNGMVKPLAGYGMRGALWYQGESNTGDAAAYRGLLRAYRDDLRAHFGKDLPLFVVQLANFGPAPTQPTESGWAELREVQREVVGEDPRSGLAVAIDIGDRYDIHPANKQELGARLARAARKVVYGEKIAPTGPVPRVAKRNGDAVEVSFADVGGKLVAYSAEGPIAFELCGDAPGSCRYAEASLRGSDTVVLRAPVANPTRVRHAWADSPVVTLFDTDGLPAGPFEIGVE